MTIETETTAQATDGTAELLERSRWHGQPVAWDEIIGHEPAKRELQVVAEQVRRHAAAERLGLTTVKGILLSGPAGSGKTMLAKALSTAVDRPAYVIPAAEVDASTIRQVYEALAGAPSILIWDEADVLLRGRWGRSAPSEGRLVAAFCSALDGVTTVSGPITIAMTAEPEHSLDPAAIRAGRLTTKVELGLPDRDERRRLFEVYIAQVPVLGDIDLERAIDHSIHMTGADISAAVMVAVGLSMLDGQDALSQSLLDEVLLRDHHVSERRRRPVDLERTAIHEAGHTLVAALMLGVDAIASISLVQIGQRTGATTLTEPFSDPDQRTRRLDRALVATCYGGLVAEELIYGRAEVGVGIGQDLQKSTSLLRNLVGSLGDGDSVGALDIDAIETGIDSDRGSGEMRVALWEAVRIESALILDQVRRLLHGREEQLRTIADAVLAAEERTLSGVKLREVLGAAIGAAPEVPAAPSRDA